LSYAEISRACDDVLKYMFIKKESHIAEAAVEKMLMERKSMKGRLLQQG
jgi:hypothetical protein